MQQATPGEQEVMKKLLCFLSVAIGCIFASVVWISAIGIFEALFLDAHSLKMWIGDYQTTTQTTVGKIIAVAVGIGSGLLARVFLVQFPDKLRNQRVTHI